ncbi:MAG: hypothetical protein IKZ19_10005 [Clostridia bacterium]|nr:hypothetical protein [Clostridia bacterium]
MENRPEISQNDEAPKVEFGKFAKFGGIALKIGFGLATTLMSCGTLLIVLYAFFGRGFIG